MWYHCAMKKKPPKKGKRGESEFDTLGRLVKSTNEKTVERLMTVIKSESEDIRGEIPDVRDGLVGLRTEMNRRFDAVDKRFDGVDEQLRDIRAEIADIRNRVEHLEEQGAVQAGYAKEIDHILQRVTYIERHLGIAKSRGR